MRASWLTLALAVGTAAPAAAQNDVARRSFGFLGNDLVIEVNDRSAGELRLVRGGRGQVDVAARALGGFAGFGLGGIVRDRLRLSSMGAYRAEYLVMVPDFVRVQVELPNGNLESPQGDETTFTWDALPAESQGGDPPAPAPEPAPAQYNGAPVPPRGTVLTYSDPVTPQVVGFPSTQGVRSIEVWMTSDSKFRVAASTPLTLSRRATDQISVNLGDVPPIDLVFMVPATAERFGIRIGNDVAIVAGNGDLESFCQSAIVLTAADGSRRARITPVNGQLDCNFGRYQKAGN